MKNAAQAYFKTGVSTVDQGQLLILLYDGALKFLKRAREKMLEKDYAAKGMLISRALDIINELASSLNMEQGGSLAENLNNLYFLCSTRLLQANLKLDVAALDSVMDILSGLRSAYAEVLERPETRAVVARIASRMQPERSLQQRAAPIMAGTTAAAGMDATQHTAVVGSMPTASLEHVSQMAALRHTVSAAAAPGGPSLSPTFVTEQLAPRMMRSTACTQPVPRGDIAPVATPAPSSAASAYPSSAPLTAPPTHGEAPRPVRGFAGKLAAYERIMGK